MASNQVKFNEDEESSVKFQLAQNQAMSMLASEMPIPEQKSDSKFKDKHFYKTKEYMVDLAHQLNAEAGALDPDYSVKQQRLKRWNKYAGKYELLYTHSPGLFWAALMGKLHEGEVGQVVAKFTSNAGNPEKISEGFDQYLNSQMTQLKGVAQDMQKMYKERINQLKSDS